MNHVMAYLSEEAGGEIAYFVVPNDCDSSGWT